MKVDGSPRMQRVLNATGSPLGPVNGTALTYSTSQFGLSPCSGYVDGVLFKITGDAIWRSVDDGESYTLVYSLISPTTTSWTSRGGPFVVYSSAGVPRIVFLYTGAAGTIRMVSSLTGLSGSWTDVDSGFAGAVFQWAYVYRNSVFYQSAGGQAFFADPFAGTFSGVSTSTLQAWYTVEWNNQPYMVGRLGGTETRLYSLAGGTFTSIVLLAADNPGTVAAWVDKTTNNLIVYFRGSTSGTNRVFEVADGTFIATERTSTMVTGSTLAGFGSTQKVAAVFYDQPANMGGAPDIYLMIANGSTAGTVVAMFKYNGVNSLMGAAGSPNDTGGDIAWAWPDKNIGGERFFTPRGVGSDGVPDCTWTGNGTLVTGAVRRKFRLIRPRSQILTTIGGTPATYDLSTTPISPTPIRAGYTTIRGTIGGQVYTASNLAAAGVLAPPTTTIAAGSNGLSLPQATINVASTNVNPSFPDSGQILVTTSGGQQTVTYTGRTATTFTGCSGGTGTMSTGGDVRGPLLPTNGTVDTAGNLTGTTATLDAGTNVEALSIGGTGTNRWYRAVATDEYPGSTTKAPLSSPTSGTISSDDNINCLADGSEQQVNIGMTGITAGTRFNLLPEGAT